MDERPTILITTNKLHNKIRCQVINRVDIMAQTKATSGVRRLALSSDNQKMPIEAGIRCTRHQQDLHPRKVVTELSDKGFTGFMRCYIVFEYLCYYDDEWDKGPLLGGPKLPTYLRRRSESKIEVDTRLYEVEVICK
jgi:hypothetical protein